MKRLRSSIALFLALAVLAAACTPATPAPTQTVAPPLQWVDDLGREVQLDALPQKIVSLAPSNTEILFAIGAGSQVVGRDDFSDYPAQAQDLPGVGGSMGSYNLEEITRLRPDLVLAAGINTPEQVKALENLGLVVYYLENPTSLEGMFANLDKVAALTGHEAEAAQLTAALQQRAAAVESALAGVEDRPQVFYELDGSDPAKPWTAGPGTFIDAFIGMAGGENVASALSGGWAQISQEELIVKDPEIILLGDSAYGVTAQQVSARPGWDQLSAVRQQNIHPFDDDLVSRPGPRLVDGLVMLAHILHPEASAGLQ